MRGVPAPALLLGLAGLLPFLIGAALLVLPYGTLPLGGLFESSPAGGHLILERYGAAILAFMGGCLWGFAAKAGQATLFWLGLSVVPGLWAFFALGPTPMLSAQNLIAGYIVLLIIDAIFYWRRIAPGWWLRLRIPLTVVVAACLALGSTPWR
ncbi:MAG: DUF3429 domain-containing protein [Pseudomonadota bacterium]